MYYAYAVRSRHDDGTKKSADVLYLGTSETIARAAVDRAIDCGGYLNAVVKQLGVGVVYYRTPTANA